TTRVADDVRVSGGQPQGADGKPGVHASEDRKLARRARRKAAQLVGTRVNFVGFQDFVDYAHGELSLAKPEEARTHHLICDCCRNIAIALIEVNECYRLLSP